MMVNGMAGHPVQKFGFENFFDQDPEAEAEIEDEEELVPPPPTFSEEELAAARSQGFVEGREAGIAEATSGLDQRTSDLLSLVVAKVDELGSAQQRWMHEREERMLSLACTIARKVVPQVARRHAQAAVEDVIRDCLPKLREEPRIVIRIHESLLDAMRKRVDDIAIRSGFPGDVILVADDQLGESDCKIEWSDGGAERTVDEIWAEIDRAVQAHISTSPASPFPEASESHAGSGQAGKDETEEKLNG